MSRQSPSGRRWQAFRQVVFQTYGRQCHLCGHDGANTVDHLLTVLEYPQYAWVLENCRPAHGTRNRCPWCGKCCNQARVSGPKRPVQGSEPIAPRLSGAVQAAKPARRNSRVW
jgi:5-methylcytosine-specific restriction endonuclease McrA